MKKTILALMIAAMAVVGVGYLAMAATSYDYDDVGTDQDVGGLPICVPFHGDGTSNILTVNLPAGFEPTLAEFHSNYTNTTNGGAFYEWRYPMAANAALVHANTSAAGLHTTGTNVWTISTGSITLPIAMHGAGSLFLGRACR